MRDERKEREIALHIAGPKAQAALRFSQLRCHPGPVVNLPSRDFVQEAAEEAADGINYSIWGLQQIESFPKGDPREGDFFAAYATALLKFIEAYNALANVAKDYREWQS